MLRRLWLLAKTKGEIEIASAGLASLAKTKEETEIASGHLPLAKTGGKQRLLRRLRLLAKTKEEQRLNSLFRSAS